MSDELEPVTRYNNPSTKVTIAFPFSAINMRGPDEQVKELAAIVVELAEQLADVAPGGGAGDLVKRARACQAALDS